MDYGPVDAGGRCRRRCAKDSHGLPWLFNDQDRRTSSDRLTAADKQVYGRVAVEDTQAGHPSESSHRRTLDTRRRATHTTPWHALPVVARAPRRAMRQRRSSPCRLQRSLKHVHLHAKLASLLRRCQPAAHPPCRRCHATRRRRPSVAAHAPVPNPGRPRLHHWHRIRQPLSSPGLNPRGTGRVSTNPQRRQCSLVARVRATPVTTLPDHESWLARDDAGGPAVGVVIAGQAPDRAPLPGRSALPAPSDGRRWAVVGVQPSCGRHRPPLAAAAAAGGPALSRNQHGLLLGGGLKRGG